MWADDICCVVENLTVLFLQDMPKRTKRVPAKPSGQDRYRDARDLRDNQVLFAVVCAVFSPVLFT